MTGSKPVLQVTLDTNCLISVEENRPDSDAVTALYKAHMSGALALAVVGIAASENRMKDSIVGGVQPFFDRLARIGFDAIHVLKPVGIWGVTYWDWCIWGDADQTEKDKQVHDILFPSHIFSYQDHCAANDQSANSPIDRKWLNRRCDIVTISTHIRNERDVFVTSDRNFLKVSKIQSLCEIGAKKIIGPTEAAYLVEQ